MAKRKYPDGRVPKKVTPVVEMIILNTVIAKPGILLREIKTELQETYGVELCESTILCEFPHKSGFSRQKMTHCQTA